MSSGIEYLLSLLDDVTRSTLETTLREDPGLRAELMQLMEAVARLRQLPEDVVPPPGLVERTHHRLLISLRRRT